MPQPVEMRPAFVWTCPLCDMENFERTIVIEADPETMQQLRDQHGVIAGDTGHFLRSPAHVECKSCEQVFAVKDSE